MDDNNPVFAIFCNDLSGGVNILQDRDVRQGEAQGEHPHPFFREYRSDDDYRRKKKRAITVADHLTQIRRQRIHPFSTA